MKTRSGHILMIFLLALIITVCLDVDESHLPVCKGEKLIQEYEIINFSDLLNDDRIQDLSPFDLHIIAGIISDRPTPLIGDYNLLLAIPGLHESVWSLLDLPPPSITI